MDTKKAQEIAKFWAAVLNITKEIRVIFFSIEPATRKEPIGYVEVINKGNYAEPGKEIEYDLIRIYLRKFEEIAVPKILEDLVYQGIILHELLHIKCPDKSEDEIKKITGEYLSGAYCFKTKCVFCDEVLPTLTELKKHLEDVHGASF